MVSELTLIESLRSIDFYLLDHDLVILTLILAFSAQVRHFCGHFDAWPASEHRGFNGLRSLGA
jgi:hypothetical protein